MSSAKRFVLAGALLLTAPAAWGQIFFSWKWIQPWTPPRAAHESRVFSCTNPQPFSHVALDDWLCGQSGPIIRYTWWGTLSTPAQGQRPYYIAVRRTLATACQPDMSAAGLLYQTCLVPDTVQYVGTDCQQRRVYRLSARPPAGVPPFIQTANTRYWLQVSEADAESVQPQVENFRWSAHRPIVGCNAVQFPPMTQPILDACDQQPNDLSFILHRKTIGGVIVPPTGFPVPPILRLNLFDGQGMLREMMCVEPDDGGNFVVTPESPDGTYIAELEGGGMLHARRTMTLQDGMETRLSFFDVFYGDLDNNHEININDLGLLLANFGRMLP